MFRALSHRNFRWFWTGAFLSNAGTWMQTVAQGWLVLGLTNSAFWLGFDGFMATIPGLVLVLVGGVFADLVDRRRLLLYTQVGAGLSALVLAVLVYTQVVNVWMVLVLSFVTGCCMSIGGPSFQAMTIDLVGREDLANAIALHSTQFQLSRVVGPLLAGVTIKAFGLAGCFFANALSYVAIMAALAQVRFDEKTTGGGEDAGAATQATATTAATTATVAAQTTATTPTTQAAEVGAAQTTQATGSERHSFVQDLLEGFRYAGKRPRVRLLLLSTATVSFFGSAYIVMIPLFARDVYGWGETGLSVMMGTAGAGAFLGALLVAYLGNFQRKGLFVFVAAFVAGVCLIGFSLASGALMALCFLFVVGFAMVSFFSVINTLLQQLVQDRMRGRVMSMWIFSFIGAMPLGNFLAGAAAARFGAPHTLAVGAFVIVVFSTLILVSNPRLREL